MLKLLSHRIPFTSRFGVVMNCLFNSYSLLAQKFAAVFKFVDESHCNVLIELTGNILTVRRRQRNGSTGRLAVVLL